MLLFSHSKKISIKWILNNSKHKIELWGTPYLIPFLKAGTITDFELSGSIAQVRKK